MFESTVNQLFEMWDKGKYTAMAKGYILKYENNELCVVELDNTHYVEKLPKEVHDFCDKISKTYELPYYESFKMIDMDKNFIIVKYFGNFVNSNRCEDRIIKIRRDIKFEDIAKEGHEQRAYNKYKHVVETIAYKLLRK